MFILKTARFEFACECGGVFVRIGQREWHWSRASGLTGR